MTAQQLLNTSLSLMSEDSAEDYEAFAIPLINVLLAETFEVNNGLRIFNGKEPAASLQLVTNLTDTLEVEDILASSALPYGLASKLLFDDDDMNRMGYMTNQYANAVNALAKCNPKPIVDVYGGGEE